MPLDAELQKNREFLQHSLQHTLQYYHNLVHGNYVQNHGNYVKYSYLSYNMDTLLANFLDLFSATKDYNIGCKT